MDCDDTASWRDGGLPVFKALKVSVAILNLIRESIGSQISQWSLFRVDELESIEPVAVTTRARVFCVRWRREMCLAGMPYTLCLKKNRTPVTFSNNSNNPISISTNFGTKNRQLIGT